MSKESMAMSRPETSWATVKNDISRMQKCLVESLKTCEILEQGHLGRLNIELTTARQRIIELECENSSLRMLLQLRNNKDRFTGGGMPESLQAEVDHRLLQAKQENEMLRERIRDLELQAECLKEQVNIYKEDFEMERKDRENAQGLITDLQKQLTLLTGSIHHLTGKNPPTPHHHYSRPRGRGFDVCDDVRSVSGKQGTSLCTAVDGELLKNAEHGFDVCDLRESDNDQAGLGLTGRGFGSISKFCADGTSENDFVVAERLSRISPPLPTNAGRSGHGNSFSFSSPLVACQNFDLIQSLSCPNCWRTFSTEDHMLLLEHLEVCS